MRRLCLLGLFLASPAIAQQPGDAGFSRTVASFIDEHTLVVARVDVSRVDLETALKLVAAFLGSGDEVDAAVPAVREWVKQLTKRGHREVFLTYGAGDFPNAPCLIASAPADATGQKELAQLLSIPYKHGGVEVDWADLHGCICVGTRDALATLKARKAVARPELTAAIDAGKGDVAQIAFALSADARKIHEQVAPTLPAELGGGSIQKITRGMKWMAVAIGPGPKLPAKWITEASSPEAAQDLRAIEALAQQAALGRLLKSEIESDAAFRRRVNDLIGRQRTEIDGSRLTTEWELATALLEAVKLPDGLPAERARSANNLKQLLLALHNYHDVYGHFPTDVRTKDGKPLLSWRVKVLPFIEQDELYRQFKLDEPWDSEHNRKLLKSMPKVLRSPRQADTFKDRTTYLAPLGKGLMWDEPNGLKIFEITDGTSNTIALVETADDRAVLWTKPEDITIDRKNPVTGLLGHYDDGFFAAFADGSVRFLKKSVDPVILWALFTRAGGESVDPGK